MTGRAIKELPEFRRPREKLRERGPQALSDAELLAILHFQKISGMQPARRTARFFAESRPEKAVVSWQVSLQDSIVVPKIR